VFDLSRVIPEARQIVERAASVYVRHAADDFVGLIVHGSAVKGGFIAGCSDIDFQLYLRREAFDENGNLPYERALQIHRDLARIDPAPFQYIQCYAFGGAQRPGWTGPISGTYAVVAGLLPVPEATSEELRSSALDRLRAIDPSERFRDSLLDHGGGRLSRQVRLLCTDVWPALYSLLIIRGDDPVASWNMTRHQAIAALNQDTDAARAIRRFNEALSEYYPEGQSTDGALEVLRTGVAFLRAAAVQARWLHRDGRLRRIRARSGAVHSGGSGSASNVRTALSRDLRQRI
jgi:hypothetical protein